MSTKKKEDKYTLKGAMNHFSLSEAYTFVCLKLFKDEQELTLSEWESKFKERNIVINK